MQNKSAVLTYIIQNKKTGTFYANPCIFHLERRASFAKEMYYGYFELKKSYDTELIEVQRTENIFRLFFSKIFTKATGLGIHFFSEFSKSGKNRIFKQSRIIFWKSTIIIKFFIFAPNS